jgi:hypothetical protein
MPKCKNKLEASLPPGTKVMFSYPYPESDLTDSSRKARRKGVRDKARAVKNHH